MSPDPLASWRDTAVKRSILEFVAAVTDSSSPDFVPEPDRHAVFDNDGTLWTEQPLYAQLAFAIDRAAELGHPTTLKELQAGGLQALLALVVLTHSGVTTEEFDQLCRKWLAAAKHPRFDRRYPELVYQPMLELLSLLRDNGFTNWIMSGGGTDFMRVWAPEAYGMAPHQVIGSVGGTDFRVRDNKAELVKNATMQTLDDGAAKPSSIHLHVGQRPLIAGGNTDGDLPMLQWSAGRPGPSLQLVIRHTDAEREYEYDHDPILGSRTNLVLAAADEGRWAVVDMASDWSTIHRG
jgi:phosphoglycolate phosphatase-like HAD superfamily hydrolase